MSVNCIYFSNCQIADVAYCRVILLTEWALNKHSLHARSIPAQCRGRTASSLHVKPENLSLLNIGLFYSRLISSSFSAPHIPSVLCLQEELEQLNQASNEINKLELQLNVRNLFVSFQGNWCPQDDIWSSLYITELYTLDLYKVWSVEFIQLSEKPVFVCQYLYIFTFHPRCWLIIS